MFLDVLENLQHFLHFQKRPENFLISMKQT